MRMIFSAVLVCFLGGQSIASSTRTLSLSGVLLDSAGNPISSTQSVTLTLLGGPTGTECALYSSVHTYTPTLDGSFQFDFGSGGNFLGSETNFLSLFDTSRSAILGSSSCVFDATQSTAKWSVAIRVDTTDMGLVPVRSVPFALRAQSAVVADSASTASRISGFPVASSAPGTNQVLAYTGSQWAPVTLSASNISSGALPVGVSINASSITTGTIPLARLPTPIPSGSISGLGPLATMSVSGTPSGSSYLKGDGTWSPLPAVSPAEVATSLGSASGDVGVGTLTPSAKLDVAGDVRAQNFNSVIPWTSIPTLNFSSPAAAISPGDCRKESGWIHLRGDWTLTSGSISATGNTIFTAIVPTACRPSVDRTIGIVCTSSTLGPGPCTVTFFASGFLRVIPKNGLSSGDTIHIDGYRFSP